jgi:hypothetical protein
VKTRTIIIKGSRATPNQQGHIRIPSDHQPQEAEEDDSFGGRYNSHPRRLFCLFCEEDKRHTTRTCQVTIQKQKKIAEAEERQNQPKQVLHTASYYSPYIPEYVRNQHPLQQPTNLVASASHSPARSALPQPPTSVPTLPYNQQSQGQYQNQQQRDAREESKALTVNNTVPESKHIY